MTIMDWLGENAAAIQAISMVILVIVTIVYVWRTHVISKATKKQADASVKMAEETREHRIMSSRPVIIQKAEAEKQADGISLGYFSHFEVHNAGNGPAIEVEISLLNNEKTSLHSHRESFLRAGDSMKFSPDTPLVNQAGSTCYLLCRYRSVLSKSTEPPPYRTGLPFEIEKSSRGQNKVIVSPAKLLFGDKAEAFWEKS